MFTIKLSNWPKCLKWNEVMCFGGINLYTANHARIHVKERGSERRPLKSSNFFEFTLENYQKYASETLPTNSDIAINIKIFIVFIFSKEKCCWNG